MRLSVHQGTDFFCFVLLCVFIILKAAVHADCIASVNESTNLSKSFSLATVVDRCVCGVCMWGVCVVSVVGRCMWCVTGVEEWVVRVVWVWYVCLFGCGCGVFCECGACVWCVCVCDECVVCACGVCVRCVCVCLMCMSMGVCACYVCGVRVVCSVGV